MLRIFEYDIDKMTGIQVWLGYTRENEATQIRIDVSKYLEKYPGASAVLLVKNPIGDLYPATISVESGIIVWNIGSADTIVSGSGQIAVTVSGTNGEIAKSACIDTILQTSLDDGDAGEAPSVYQTWLDKMLDAASKTEQNALAAANASANATQSAVNAGKSEQNAKASANAAAATETRLTESVQNANNAAVSANASSRKAEDATQKALDAAKKADSAAEYVKNIETLTDEDLESLLK